MSRRDRLTCIFRIENKCPRWPLERNSTCDSYTRTSSRKGERESENKFFPSCAFSHSEFALNVCKCRRNCNVKQWTDPPTHSVLEPLNVNSLCPIQYTHRHTQHTPRHTWRPLHGTNTPHASIDSHSQWQYLNTANAPLVQFSIATIPTIVFSYFDTSMRTCRV